MTRVVAMEVSYCNKCGCYGRGYYAAIVFSMEESYCSKGGCCG